MFHHSSSRNGAVYSNTTESIDCDAEPLQPWRHGYDVMKALREVSRTVLKCQMMMMMMCNDLMCT